MSDPSTSTPQRREGAPTSAPALEGVSPLSRTPLRLFLVCELMLVSAVAWRRGVYYSGGVDGVVVIKAALSLAALALAATAPRHGATWSSLRVGPLPLLACYLAISCVGAALHGGASATAVLIARVLVITLTVLLLLRAYPGRTVLSSLCSAMLLLAAVGAATGFGSLAAEGRLYGGIPPLNANEISMLVSIPLACLVWRWTNHVATALDIATVAPLLGVIWLTGTRTGLAALLLSCVILVLMAPRVPAPLLSLGLLAIPALLAVLLFTPVLSQYATRGDEASTLTLNNRTVAWTAALHYADTAVERWFGVGLSVKEIPVTAMYRTEQILDSTWISAVVQSGLLGTATLALLVLLTLARAARVAPPYRSLGVAVLTLLVVLSLLESGLFDASSTFIAFLCFALVMQPLPQQEGRP